MHKIKVMVIDPGKDPKILEIENTLRSFQEIVDGYIECIYPWKDIILICNDEGWIKELPLNRFVKGQLIVGSFILAGDDRKGDFCSLTDQQIEFLKKELR